MSSLLPRPERSATSQISKPQRVLACVACQQRKVKCDRKFPCANCLKSQSQCVPSTLAPRRRRRRFPERDLLERLRKYKDLLRQNNIEFEAFQKEPVEKDFSTFYNSDDEQPGAVVQDSASLSQAVRSERLYEAKYLPSKKFYWKPDD
jgi:hypothetical protein